MSRKKMTTVQAEMLVDFMEGNPRLIHGRVDDVFNSQDKSRLWAELAENLNNYGCYKTSQKWSKAWSDMKIVAKNKMIRYKRSLQRPRKEGRPPSSSCPPSSLELRIVRLILPHLLEDIPIADIEARANDNNFTIDPSNPQRDLNEEFLTIPADTSSLTARGKASKKNAIDFKSEPQTDPISADMSEDSNDNINDNNEPDVSMDSDSNSSPPSKIRKKRKKRSWTNEESNGKVKSRKEPMSAIEIGMAKVEALNKIAESLNAIAVALRRRT